MNKYNLHLIAPSGYAYAEKVNLAAHNWQMLGHSINNISAGLRQYLRFGGQDNDRIIDIQLDNISTANYTNYINIVMPVRGGYGLSRILDDINWHKAADNINKHQLKVIGHSDFTLFHLALYALTNTISYAGPMFTSDFAVNSIAEIDPFMWQTFNDAMQNKQLNYSISPININNTNKIDVILNKPNALPTDAILWGGNLAMLCCAIGTKYMPKIQQGILFIEDINEQPYCIERMLHQLYHAKILQCQQAIIFADFNDYKLTAYDNGYNLQSVFDYWENKLNKYNVKVYKNLPFGHIAKKATLSFGAKASIQYINQEYNLHIDKFS